MKCYNESLLPEGDYDGVIVDAEVKSKPSEKSRSGVAEWMEIKLSITDGDGETHIVFDNIFPREMGEVMAAIGKPQTSDKFEVEPDDLIGESFRCRIYIDEYQGKRKNKVQKYWPKPAKPTLNSDGDPDNIPF